MFAPSVQFWISKRWVCCTWHPALRIPIISKSSWTNNVGGLMADDIRPFTCFWGVRLSLISQSDWLLLLQIRPTGKCQQAVQMHHTSHFRLSITVNLGWVSPCSYGSCPITPANSRLQHHNLWASFCLLCKPSQKHKKVAEMNNELQLNIGLCSYRTRADTFVAAPAASKPGICAW